MGFILGLFIVCVGGCYMIAKVVGNILFPDRDNRSRYIDKSVHHHHTTIHHHHEHKNITVIDEQTRKVILELKDYQKN